LALVLTAVALGTGPTVASSADPDGDGLTTTFEVGWSHTDPNVADTDGNGTRDGQEDPDGDGLDNRWEQRLRLDPLSTDTDGDGISDAREDPDGDRLGNWFEIHSSRTDPFSADTDHDGIHDGAEDPDGDRLSNAGEYRYGTDPRDADSDDNGVDDWHADSDGDGVPDGLNQDAGPVPAGVMPSVSHLRDRPESYRRCHRVAGQSKPKVCILGKTGPRVVVVGDSHALQWRAALERLAQSKGWRLYFVTKSSCPVAQVAGVSPDCVRWRKLAFAMIARVHPAMIIASNYDSYVSSAAHGTADNARLWRHGLTKGLQDLRGRGVKVVLLGDTSRWHRPQDCIRRHLDDISRCGIRRSEAVSVARIANDRAAATAAGARYVRTVGLTCPYDPCPMIIDRLILAYDSGHITNAFSRTLWRGLGDLLPRP
jgi:hypothetical protein